MDNVNKSKKVLKINDGMTTIYYEITCKNGHYFEIISENKRTYRCPKCAEKIRVEK